MFGHAKKYMPLEVDWAFRKQRAEDIFFEEVAFVRIEN